MMNSPLDATTLILIPCCAAKATGGTALKTDPITSMLPSNSYAQLCAARHTALKRLLADASLLADSFIKNRNLKEGGDFGGAIATASYLPALERYTGNLYSVPGLRSSLYKSASNPNAPKVMILSALYGLLHPLSPIQDYNLRMDQSPAHVWRSEFTPALEAYVRKNEIRSIVLLVGSMTAYNRIGSNAASALLRRGLIVEATQFHVHDGNTRATPVEHGRILNDLINGRSPDSARVEQRSISATGHANEARPSSVATVSRDASAASARALTKVHSEQRMRRAPPPNADAAELARIAAQNASQHSPIAKPALDIFPAKVMTADPIASMEKPPAANFSRASTAGLRPNVSSPSHAARFHDLLRELTNGTHQGLPLADLLEIGSLPERGVYFFLDPVTPADPHGLRVCRVGTHAVSVGSKSSLRSRLRAHLGTRSGSGNHRGSIFRLHVGNAILRRDQLDIPTWGTGSVAPLALRESEPLKLAEGQHEQRVSQYIGRLPVLWVSVPDEASPASERSIIERNSIALLSREARANSNSTNPWLGSHSPRAEIRSSRLWNLNYLDDEFDPAFFAVLERAVSRTLG